MDPRVVRVTGLFVGVLGICGPALAADPPWRLASADGKSYVQFGLLAQPQGEWITTPGGEDTAQNLYLRRLRLVAGGKISERISFFIETDSPNLGKAATSGKGKTQDFFLQDVILTLTLRDEFQIDAGMLLVPLSHNGGQGATTLMAVDYGPYSFVHSEPMTCRAGRDYGVQTRGYLLSKHFEYRLGAYQGVRDPNATASLRYAARAVWYPFEAETGFFYTGTNLGARRILAVGASYDHQDDYSVVGGDVYWDWKLPDGNGVSAQMNIGHLDGGRTAVALPEQNDWLTEIGFYHKASKLGPFLQASGRDYSVAALADEKTVVGGVAYWVSGHRANLKAGIGRITRTGAPAKTQFVVQGQIYFY